MAAEDGEQSAADFCLSLAWEIEALAWHAIVHCKSPQKRTIPRTHPPLKSVISKFQIRKRQDLQGERTAERQPADRSTTPVGREEAARLHSAATSSPAPRPQSTEKPPRRPNSSLAAVNRPVATGEWQRSALRAFLQEFRDWAADERNVFVSVALKRRADDLWIDINTQQPVDSKCVQKLIHDLEAFSGAFPASLANLYHKLTSKSSSQVTISTKMRLEQAISCITVKKLCEFKSMSSPSAEVEVTCLAFLLLLSHLDGSHVLSLHKSAWKSFQAYLLQPGKCLQALKRSVTCIETGVISEDLVDKLHGKIEQIEESALKATGAMAIHRYLRELVAYFNEIWSEVPFPSVSEQDEICSPDSARDQLLSSLCNRSSTSPHRRIQSETVALSPRCDSPALSFGDKEKPLSPQFPESLRAGCEEVAVTHREVPPKCESPQLVCEEGAATARFAAKREEDPLMKRSKSSSRLGKTPGRQQDRKEWEAVLTRVVQEKMAICGNCDDLMERRSEVIWEVRRRVEGKKGSKSDIDSFLSRASDPERFKQEASRAYAAYERQKHARKPQAPNWTQLQLQREKEKLLKGMAKFARVK